MDAILIQQLEAAAQMAGTWGLLIVLLFMTIESSFIPFPSEVVMIPAGFMAARQELFPGDPLTAATLAVACGTIGSLLGAYINYFLAYRYGRPFLHANARWLFLSPNSLDRAEEVFREYGDVATFVCRLLPAIRQLISLPAGLSRMDFRRFSFFTGLGAGIWVVILTAIGFHLGSKSKEMSYAELVAAGKEMVRDDLVYIVAGCAVVVVAWLFVHRRVMHGSGARA
ncbi:Inner membrane protein YqjA [Myxococcaceae bacterium]|nr:Inner membrane protein YqjA [Myxococcaceae bacterium]